VARQQVFDSPAWCGAASTIVCGGRGGPRSWWRSFLVESRIKVTSDLARAFVASQEVPGETWLPGNNTLYECFNNMDVRVALCLTKP